MKKLLRQVKQLNIADYFSLYRFVAVPLIVLTIIYGLRHTAGALLLISFITDAVDGYLARQRKIESSRGAMLDSVGDLLTLLVGFAAFIVFETQFFKDHAGMIIASLSLYFIQAVFALFKFKTITSYHTYLAKLAAVLLAAFLIITLVLQPSEVLFYLTFSVTIAEATEEIAITAILKEPRENVKGLWTIWRSSHN